MQTTTRLLVSPIGGFGNHLRNLCLLDNKFVLDNQNRYSCNLDFLLENVYPLSRTWHNWIYIEWNCRERFNQLIPFVHHIHEISNPSQQKIVCTNISPETCYKNYVKFNSNLNNNTKEQYFAYCQQEKINLEKLLITNPDVLTINGDEFYNSSLPCFMQDVFNYLDLDVTISDATTLHSRWFKLQKNAEQGIVQELSNLYT